MTPLSKTCIVLATDSNLFDHTETLIRSISANYKGKEKLNVVVLVSRKIIREGMSFPEVANLEISLRYPESVQLHEDSGMVENMYSKTKFTGASMYRYFVGTACPEFDKAIYIDIDCVVARDLGPMLEFELVNAPIAAFQEMHLEHLDNPVFRDAAYFNSGVMIIDLNYWRDNVIEDLLLEVSRDFENWTGSADQDILNVVFKNDWTPLHINFNYLVNIYPGLKITNPIIVHFAGLNKPWKSSSPDTKWKQLWQSHSRKIDRK
jgi:lipopolysaccharide biosynthesis glycosyltransferase